MMDVEPIESTAEILSRLHSEARRLWGEERMQELETSIQDTAENLLQIATNLPDPSIEPGFYQ